MPYVSIQSKFFLVVLIVAMKKQKSILFTKYVKKKAYLVFKSILGNSKKFTRAAVVNPFGCIFGLK